MAMLQETVTDIEAEHALQYKLLAEAERLLHMRENEAARGIMRQLYDYSEVHFASEQTLMRLHSYPGYAAHEREHGDLLAALASVIGNLEIDGIFATATLQRWLSTHIHQSDQAFLEYVRARGFAAASSGA